MLALNSVLDLKDLFVGEYKFTSYHTLIHPIKD